MWDLLIRNGTVVTAHGEFLEDVAVAGGKIARRSLHGTLSGPAEQIVDATGSLVMPGVIDAHNHLPLGEGSGVHPWRVNSIAAAHGGITTLLDFARSNRGNSVAEAVKIRRAEADPNVAIDYALHFQFADWPLPEPDVMASVKAAGISSVKVFMNNWRFGCAMGDGQLYDIFRKAAVADLTVGLHAENQPLIDYLTEELKKSGKTGVEWFPQSRRAIVEVEAVTRAITLARATGTRLYFFHITAAQSVDAIRLARQEGLPIFAETCPHYLLFDDSVYGLEFEKAIRFIRFPALKSAKDREALWSGLRDETLSVLGTDHVPVYWASKLEQSQGRPFYELPGGMALNELFLNSMYSHGVAAGKIDLKKLVACLTENPARVFGLYPRKGTLEIGSDADIVLFDPHTRWTVTADQLHMDSDYSIHEGEELQGRVRATILRGKLIVKDGAYVGQPGEGMYLCRNHSPLQHLH